MVINRFTVVRNKSSDTPPPVAETGASAQSERFQTEVYKAIEILGRKLERSEAERALLEARLAQIESAATIDDGTGRMYLPAVVEKGGAAASRPVAAIPKSTLAMMHVAVFVAFLSLGIEFFKPPQLPVQIGTVLNKDQMAALDALTLQHMTGILSQGIQPGEWQDVGETAAAAPAETAETPAAPVAEAEPTQAAEPESVAAADTTAKADNKVVEAEAPAPVAEKEAPARKAEPAARSTTRNYIEIERDENLPARFSRLEERAYQGVAEAQHDLATVYAAGKDVQQDYKRAAYWFAHAADGRIGNAHYNLGVMFQQGLGVQKDLKKAIGWYRSAADLGHPEAMYNLGIAYTEGVGVTPDAGRGASYFKRAAEAGIAQAAYNLGVLYESEFLGQPDRKQAIYWYTKARQKGSIEAKSALERLKKA